MVMRKSPTQSEVGPSASHTPGRHTRGAWTPGSRQSPTPAGVPTSGFSSPASSRPRGRRPTTTAGSDRPAPPAAPSLTRRTDAVCHARHGGPRGRREVCTEGTVPVPASPGLVPRACDARPAAYSPAGPPPPARAGPAQRLLSRTLDAHGWRQRMEGQVMEHTPEMEQTCRAAVPGRSSHASGVRCRRRVLAHSGMIACWDAEQGV